jgi:peptidyl-prolyl cis-trans isomerase B (cyclophilin B)
LDFSFAIPTGWTVEKNDREESDVGGRIITLYGPSVEGSSPIIYINVDGFQKFNPDTETAFARNSFENMVNALLERYHQLEEQGNVVLISEGPGVINGKDVYTITGTQLDFILGGEIKFKQTLFSSKSLVYGITYYNFSQNFSDEIDTYENFVSDFTIISEEKQKQNIEEAREQAEKTAEELEFATDEFGEVIFKEPEEVGGGCLIATAAFGSELAPQVQLLREIRDNTVLQTESGTSFMNGFNQFYYSFSPIIADYERENPVFKEVMKLALTPLLTSLSLLQYTEIDSESQMLGYGIGIILLNIGMYFVAPAVLITKIRSFYKLQ